MLRNRFPPVLEDLSDEELNQGLQELAQGEEGEIDRWNTHTHTHTHTHTPSVSVTPISFRCVRVCVFIDPTETEERKEGGISGLPGRDCERQRVGETNRGMKEKEKLQDPWGERRGRSDRQGWNREEQTGNKQRGQREDETERGRESLACE